MRINLLALLFAPLLAFGQVSLTQPGETVSIGDGIRLSEKPFSPLDLPGLAAWYSADYGVLTSVSPDVAATNGQTVRRWLDRSGNGRHLDQPTLLNQPTLTGGRVTFDGTTSFLDGTAGLTAVFRNKQCGYVFCVVKDTSPNSAGSNFRPVVVARIGSTQMSVVTSVRTDGTRNVGGRRLTLDSSADSSTITLTANRSVVEGHFLFGGGNVFGVTNGIAATPVNYSSGAGSSQDSDMTWDIGKDAFSRYFWGETDEIVVINEPLSETQILKLRQYLARKWGISL